MQIYTSLHSQEDKKKNWKSLLLYYDQGRGGLPRGVLCPFPKKTLDEISTRISFLPDAIKDVKSLGTFSVANDKSGASRWVAHFDGGNVIFDRYEDALKNGQEEIEVSIAHKIFTDRGCITNIIRWSSIYNFNLGRRGRICDVTRSKNYQVT